VNYDKQKVASGHCPAIVKIPDISLTLHNILAHVVVTPVKPWFHVQLLHAIILRPSTIGHLK